MPKRTVKITNRKPTPMKKGDKKFKKPGDRFNAFKKKAEKKSAGKSKSKKSAAGAA